jgi:hypothetical protein
MDNCNLSIFKEGMGASNSITISFIYHETLLPEFSGFAEAFACLLLDGHPKDFF